MPFGESGRGLGWLAPRLCKAGLTRGAKRALLPCTRRKGSHPMNLDSYDKALEQAKTELAFALAQGDAAAEDAAAEKIAALEQLGRESWIDGLNVGAEVARLGARDSAAHTSEAQAAAASLIAEHGWPKSDDSLRNLLALAYASGALVAATEAAEAVKSA